MSWTELIYIRQLNCSELNEHRAISIARMQSLGHVTSRWSWTLVWRIKSTSPKHETNIAEQRNRLCRNTKIGFAETWSRRCRNMKSTLLKYEINLVEETRNRRCRNTRSALPRHEIDFAETRKQFPRNTKSILPKHKLNLTESWNQRCRAQNGFCWNTKPT